MKKKARIWVLGLAVVCSACAAPSLRYKSDVQKLMASGKLEEAAGHIEAKKNKMYAAKDVHLYALDKAALLHDAHQLSQSDILLSQAQDRIDDLYTKSATATLGKVVINDLTTPYEAADYERAFTYFYRAMNFLEQDNLQDAAVEARKAVFFLDDLRGRKKNGYTDDPFIQYVASLVFESVGQVSDARISRQNAENAYRKQGLHIPHFSVPAEANQLGEIILFHYNGRVPLKKTQTLQLAWDRAMSIASSPQETRYQVAPEVQNAIYAGIMGSAITIALPTLEPQHYAIQSSLAVADGQQYPLTKMADLSFLARQDLDENMPGIWFRTVTRAVVKRIAAVQARHAAQQSSEDRNVGDLAEMVISIIGAAFEKADTRQWFTLPAEVHLTRFFVSPGTHEIHLFLKDGNGNIVGEKTFKNVTVGRGGRVFLHHRSAY
ncbi:MAG: hypothetical protein J5601_00685 [Elusimicrobiaceae bacterium]|nr:hypothetical protein [Elusimicrobiaceae bacterium]